MVLETIPLSALGPAMLRNCNCEQQLGGVVEGGDIRARKTVLKANAREREPSNGIAGKEREASAVLIVVLNELRVDADGLPEQESRLPGLVKFVAAGENRETGRDGPVKEIGLGETKEEAAREIAELRGKRKSFAKAEEIVGLIG